MPYLLFVFVTLAHLPLELQLTTAFPKKTNMLHNSFSQLEESLNGQAEGKYRGPNGGWSIEPIAKQKSM